MLYLKLLCFSIIIQVFLLFVHETYADKCFNSQTPQVWATISARIHRKVFALTKPIERLVEINWLNIPVQSKGVWLGLFKKKVTKLPRKGDSLFFVDNVTLSEGKSVSRTTFPVIKFNLNHTDYDNKCLDLSYVYAIKDGKIIAENCIKPRSQWMHRHYQTIKSKALTQLKLPGTHNSGAYTVGYRWKSVSQWLEDRYTICQDESIFNQLVWGIRYLDLRVMNRPKNGEDFWIAHDTFRMDHTLRSVLEQVKHFMDMTKSEIVIIDFHRFPEGFNKNPHVMHNKLLHMIEEILGKHLAFYNPSSLYSVKVEQIINNGKRLIVGYPRDVVTRSFTYPQVNHIWANTGNIDYLKKYIVNNLKQSSNYMLRAAMAQLTIKLTRVRKSIL